jgi:hypothetical protein
MIGKKIRCRTCGEIFMAISDADTDPSLKSEHALKPRAPQVPEDPDDMLL